MINNIKELRLKVDGLSQLVKELKPIQTFEAVYKVADEEVAHIYKSAGNVIRINKNSCELDKCYDSLILSKAWMGKILETLGSATPYKNDGNRKDVKDIEPTSDTNEMMKNNLKIYGGNLEHPIDGNWIDFPHIQRVDWIREEIKKIISEIEKFHTQSPYGNQASTNAYTHLSEARFWLGFELQRIRENNN